VLLKVGRPDVQLRISGRDRAFAVEDPANPNGKLPGCGASLSG